MKFFVVFVCCVCFLKLIVSFFSSLFDYVRKPFSVRLLADLLFESAFVLCGELVICFACRYACLAF